MKQMKRMVAALLVMAMIFCTTGMSVFAETMPIRTKDQSSQAGEKVTRIQWLEKLCETFSMDVLEENYADNYYSDMKKDSPYYKLVMIATEFGLSDVAEGETFQPEAMATREYIAFTMNQCMGFALDEGDTYTFAEAENVTYKEDIQVALNQGWMTLNSGNFLPMEGITATEMTALLDIAKAEIASRVVAENHTNQYNLAQGVLDLTQKEAEMTDENQITIYDSAAPLMAGQNFAVLIDGFPVVKCAAAVMWNEDKLVVTTSNISTAQAFQTVDIAGSVEGDLRKTVPYDSSVSLTYIVGGTEEKEYEDGRAVDSLEQVGDSVVNAVYATKEFIIPDPVKKEYDIADGVTAEVTCKITKPTADYDIDFDQVYCIIESDVSFSCNISVDVLEAIGVKDVTLAKVPVGGVGVLKATLELEANGMFQLDIIEHVEMGVKWTKKNGLRMVKDFEKKLFTIAAEINLGVGLKLTIGVDFVVLSGSIWGRFGAASNTKSVTYIDGQSPTRCTHVKAWLYAEVGTKSKIDIIVWEKTYNKDVTIYKESNSPVRVVFHYEDGKPVSACTRVGAKTETGTTKEAEKYVTPIDSPYGNSGANTGKTSTGEDLTLFEYEVDGSQCTITKYNGNLSAVHIPEKLDKYKVTEIGYQAFKECVNIKTVYIPDTVKIIGANAFQMCSNLQRVVMSDSLEEIGKLAFHECFRLEDVTMSKGLKKIGFQAFKNCTALTDIFIPKSLTESSCFNEEGPFYGCTGLKNITFEDGITMIPEGLFAGSVITEMEIPSTVETIGPEAFRYCLNLKKVDFPDGLKTIKYGAFRECSALEKVDIPDSVTRVELQAFWDCTNLNDVKLSDNLEYLGYCAFKNCDKITDIFIPESLTECGVQLMKEGPFAECDGIKNIEFEEGITTLVTGLFAGCPSIVNIIIPETVEVIGAKAFVNCANLEKVTFPPNLELIEEYAFQECPFLEDPVFPESLLEIKDHAFNKCESIINLTLPKNLTALGNQAFRDCIYMKKVEIPKSLVNEKYSARPFYGCAALNEVVFEEGITVLPQYLFANCTGLENIVLPETLTEIGKNAFSECTNLEEIVIPNGVHTIGEWCFDGCSSLAKVTLSAGLTELKTATFQGCVSLEELIIPYMVTSIQGQVFSHADNLVKITIPKSVRKMASNTFINCAADLTVYGVEGSYAQEFTTEKGFTFRTIEKAATNVTLQAVEVTAYVGDTAQVVPVIIPLDYTGDISFTSSDETIATVDGQGMVKGIKVGTVTITVVAGGETLYCTVNIEEPPLVAMAGDVNGDGAADALDALEILKNVAGMITLTSEQLQIADVEKDGAADALDALKILKYVAGMVSSL